MEDKFYVLHKTDGKHRGLSKKNTYEFVDITDLFSSGDLEIKLLNTKFPMIDGGDPNEGLDKNSRYYITPKRILRRPYQNKDMIIAREMLHYATEKKKNIKNLFETDLNYNAVGIFSEGLPSRSVDCKDEGEYVDWMLALKCVNLVGNLEKLEEEYNIKKYSVNELDPKKILEKF